MAGKKLYDQELCLQLEENKLLSQKLIELFESCSLKDIHIASVGNSISSGYSKCDEMLPLLARSELYTSGAPISFYSYARVRKNEELNIIKWYKSNISHQDINNLLISDILAKKDKYANFSEEHLQVYKKMAANSNIGLNDFIKLKDNIIIYNGLSGTFTDRMRKGNFQDKTKILSSFKEDFYNLRSLLLQIYLDNPRIQIYICGLPNLMGLGISNIYDNYIKSAIKTVPNAHYIPGSTHNVLSISSKQKEIDIHYNKIEYLQLLNRVFKEILKEYIPMMIKNVILEKLASESFSAELVSTLNVLDDAYIIKIIDNVFDEYGNLMEMSNISKNDILESVWEYYNDYYLINYGCTNRKMVKSVIKNMQSQ